MTTLQIDRLNIGLILISLALAFVFPFWLFLASYAILGPLHYLTEISWLNDKEYYVKSKIAPIILTVLCVITSFTFVAEAANLISDKDTWINNALHYLIDFRIEIVIASFVGTFGFYIFKKQRHAILFMLACFLVLAFLPHMPYALFMFGAFIPTVLHVFIFTALFMLWGALRGGSKTGLFAFFLLLFCVVPIIFLPDYFSQNVDENALGILTSSGLYNINAYIATLFGYHSTTGFEITPLIRKVQIFVAFIYTYHYLNWFSKTGIIRWHQVSKLQLVITLVIWLASVALYFYNYRYGIVVLFFLGLLHVFLEFPLNVVSFMEIPKQFRAYRNK